jgi:hypothetical protein
LFFAKRHIALKWQQPSSSCNRAAICTAKRSNFAHFCGIPSLKSSWLRSDSLTRCLVYAQAATLWAVNNSEKPATAAGWRKAEMVCDRGLLQMTRALGRPMNAIIQPGSPCCALASIAQEVA